MLMQIQPVDLTEIVAVSHLSDLSAFETRIQPGEGGGETPRG